MPFFVEFSTLLIVDNSIFPRKLSKKREYAALLHFRFSEQEEKSYRTDDESIAGKKI